MTKDVDEDLIEQTIRRVQGSGTPAGEAKQAPEPDEDAIQAAIRRVQAQAQPPLAEALRGDESDDQPQGSYTPAEQSRIEDTIRRVRTQAAAHAEDFAPVSEQPSSSDEDPIEATIRRVQEQAARAAQDVDGSDPEVDEDPIEATIRRVQAQAANEAASASASDGPTEDAIEATIQRVQAQAAQASPIVEGVGDIDDEDPIEATIRRVQAQAARSSDGGGDLGDADESVPSVLRSADVVEEAIRVAESETVAAAEASVAIETESPGVEARPEPTPWPGRDERLLGEASTWEVAALRLEQGLQDAQREVRSMAARLAELERVVGAGAAGGVPPLSVVQPSAAAADDDEWDDRPQVSSMQFGTPPRPPVYRDPSPQTATAAEFVEELAPVVEKPAARLRAIDAEGNLDDRIPRQYRITVEDKRRGVDLVPLHRAMQGLDSVKDMSLLSYSNGVAMVLVESVGPLDPEILRLAVGRVMSRETLVEVHNEQTMVIKIQEE